MSFTPKFEGPDLVLREQFVFSTTLQSRFFAGTIDPSTVDMQVKIRSDAYTSNPDLIAFEGTSFVIPNPSVYPDGLDLLPGDNEIRVKAVLANGQISPEGLILARLVKDRDLGNSVLPPTGISIERFDRTVVVTIEGVDDPDVVGYHFYASTQPGGGITGYSRINPAMVISSLSEEVFATLAELTNDATIATKNDGTPAADPLFFVLHASQQDSLDTVLQTDINEPLEVPETTKKIRTSIKVESVSQTKRFSFTHDRLATFSSNPNPAIPNAAFNTIPTGDPLYYVASAVYFVDNEEFESALSPEVAGAPLYITPSLATFPTLSRQQIVRDVVLSIFRSQPQLDIKPGAVIRDAFIDPFSTEGDRIRFLIDFLHAAQSFATLLPIDDPTFSGQSIPVAQSPYKMALKQALFLQSNDAVQSLIDNTFEKLASNFGKRREPGRRARGEALLYTKTRPTTTVQIPLGTVLIIAGVRFRTTSSSGITSNGSGSFFNPATGRYATRVFIQAEDPGLTGNLASGQIGRIEGGILDVQVLLEANTFGGTDAESNRDLASKAQRALSSVDSGTVQGYSNAAIDVPGVSQANVVQAGHPLMQRDRSADGTHTGGKVDIWIRGENLATVTDAFAFSFAIAKSIQFEPLGDPQDLKFRAVDPLLSVDNPIIEMLDFPAYGYEFVNRTTGHVFVLTGVTVISYNAIQLSAASNDQTMFSLTDEIRGAYRYRTSNNYVFTRQPVRDINSFQGEVSGIISPSVYDLYHSASPLELGRSTEAGDYLKVVHPEVLPKGTTIPSSSPLIITSESHVILDGTEYLNFLGANPLTVRVFNQDKSVEYLGPFASNAPDFDIINAGTLVPLGIKTTAGSAIKQGDTVLIDYDHDENFSVSYDTNALVGIAQNSVEDIRHATADAMVKEAVAVPVDLSVTVVLQNRKDVQISPGQVDGLVRTALARLFGALSLSEPLRQGDVVHAIDAVTGVSYPVVPLSKMVRGDGSSVINEVLTVAQEVDVTLISAWSSATVSLFLLNTPLEWNTTSGGGLPNEFRGVFQDEARLVHFDSGPNPNGYPLKVSTGGAYIIGAEGIILPGFSDDGTITTTYGLTLAADIEAKRVELTANRVLVTMTPGDTPLKHAYAVTYVVTGATGVKNIVPGPAEYLVQGNIELTFDEDTDFQARVKGKRV